MAVKTVSLWKSDSVRRIRPLIFILLLIAFLRRRKLAKTVHYLQKWVLKTIHNISDESKLTLQRFQLYFLSDSEAQRIQLEQELAASRQQYIAHTDMDTIQACLLSTEHLDIGRIEKRTLFVRRLEEVFPNQYIREKIHQAALELSTDEECVLCTKLSSTDKWHVLNACTNRLSELFAAQHVCFNEARRHDSYYKSSWYVFTLTCTRTNGSGRFFITPSRPVLSTADVGQLCIRIVMVSENELRKIASGELEVPAKGFFNERHNGRWRVLSRVASLFVRQLENVTGETFSKTQDWGSNLCGSIGASALERRNLRLKQFGQNSTQYAFLDNNINPVIQNMNNNMTNDNRNEHKHEQKQANGHINSNSDSPVTKSSSIQRYDPYLPEDNCFLRIHIPFPSGNMVHPNEGGRRCTDVVLFS